MDNKNGLHFNRQNGYVYIARRGDGLIKIGGAYSAENRLREHRRKDHQIKLIAKIKSERYMYLEKFIHAELKDFKVASEVYKNEKRVIEKVVNFLRIHGDIFGSYEIFFMSVASQAI